MKICKIIPSVIQEGKAEIYVVFNEILIDGGVPIGKKNLQFDTDGCYFLYAFMGKKKLLSLLRATSIFFYGVSSEAESDRTRYLFICRLNTELNILP
jgi:hypothetical protein